MRTSWCGFFILKLLHEALIRDVFLPGQGGDNPIDRFWAAKTSTTALLQEANVIFTNGITTSDFQSGTWQMAMDDILLHQPELGTVLSPMRVQLGLPPLPPAEHLDFSRLREAAAGLYCRLVAPFSQRRLFASSSGHVGIAPKGARTGDLVVVCTEGKATIHCETRARL